jgi:hypothetical protein
LLDRPWTPGDARQAEDRVRRIGQTKPVQSIWVTAFDLDAQIDQMLEQKSSTAHTVLVHGSAEDDPTEAPRLSIFQLLKKILPQQPREALVQTSLLSYTASQPTTTTTMSSQKDAS